VDLWLWVAFAIVCVIIWILVRGERDDGDAIDKMDAAWRERQRQKDAGLR
jgi:hypothetical protein